MAARATLASLCLQLTLQRHDFFPRRRSRRRYFQWCCFFMLTVLQSMYECICQCNLSRRRWIRTRLRRAHLCRRYVRLLPLALLWQRWFTVQFRLAWPWSGCGISILEVHEHVFAVLHQTRTRFPAVVSGREALRSTQAQIMVSSMQRRIRYGEPGRVETADTKHQSLYAALAHPPVDEILGLVACD
jgi:hypothetical protein